MSRGYAGTYYARCLEWINFCFQLEQKKSASLAVPSELRTSRFQNDVIASAELSLSAFRMLVARKYMTIRVAKRSNVAGS